MIQFGGQFFRPEFILSFHRLDEPASIISRLGWFRLAKQFFGAFQYHCLGQNIFKAGCVLEDRGWDAPAIFQCLRHFRPIYLAWCLFGYALQFIH